MDKKHLAASLFALFFAFNTTAQNVEVIKFKDLDRLINERKDEYRIFNFWATWCKPCIVELQYFEKLRENYKGNLTVYLISFDFVEELETKVKPFAQEKKLQSEIKLLDETDYNSFIDKISEEWSGAIPATLFVDNRNGNKEFYEGELEEKDLLDKFSHFTD